STIPFFSTVEGDWIDTEALDAGYWYRNLRRTVRFEEAVRALAGQDHTAFVEVSAHPVLAMSIQDTAEDAVVTGTLRRDEGGLDRFLTSLGELWVHGIDVDWAQAFAGTGAHHTDLPTYAFQHRRYWLDAPPAEAVPTPVLDDVDARFWEAVESGDLESLASTLDVEGEAEQSSLGSVLPALSAWRQQRRTRSTLDRWRYRLEWKRIAERPDENTRPGTWLLVVPAEVDDDAWAVAAGKVLAQGGATVIPLAWTAADGDREQLARRIGEIGALDGVLSLLALDETPHPRHPEVPLGLAGTLQLVQALGDAGVDVPLWLATRGAVSAGGADPTVVREAQAQVWGLGRVVGLEYPQRWGGLVDLPEAPEERALARLRGVLAARAAGDEDQLALRAEGVFALRLRRAPVAETRAVREWKPQGTVLITGGTGALGGRVARRLAQRGAQHLVLVSRRGAQAPGAEELRAELTGIGVRVTVAACDVTDRVALAGLLERLRADKSPVRSVVHTAGAAPYASLAETDLTMLSEVASGKVTGAVHLDELLADDELDAFVLFSSSAGVWGAGGQGAYAAANAHLDALAQRRRALGRPATSVAWGAWAESGMLTDNGAEEHMSRLGVLAMDPELALEAFQQALDHDENCTVVADVDWARFAPGFAAARPRPLLDDLPEARQALLDSTSGDPAAGDGGDAGAGASLADRLGAMTAPERDRTLLGLVRSQAAAVLRHDGADGVGENRAFNELGFDSLTAVELRNRLQKATGLRLSTALVFDHPTPVDLAAHLRDRLVGPEGDGAGSAIAELDRLEAAVFSLSPADEDLRTTITSRLAVLLSRLGGSEESAPAADAAGADVEERLGTASDNEIFDFINREFGKS
ncbi:SDR family NAD(P)-dependent oxidoreductase, partial [Streptomyces sp. NPDC046759]|uniref:SDR family NAD(P)-dependent oxidoreductase n=1 Tax=Streptomyces sp. NPDC046759 TaxID=3155019 RepID=UPI0034053A1A